MGTTWKLYHSGPLNHIGLSEVWQCITLLRDTAKVHRDRDFPPPKIAALARAMVDKINIDASGRNWMKANCRFNDDDPHNVYMDVVILYHLVKHRGRQWCVSVGFDQSLLPVPDPVHPKDPNDAANPYVVLARELSATIRNDLSGFIPPARQWCSIDDVGTNADGSEPDATLRLTRIGELEYTSLHNTDIQAQWSSVTRRRRPKPPIPGWGRTADTEVGVLEVTR